MRLPERSSHSRMVSAEALGVVTRRIYNTTYVSNGESAGVGAKPRRKHEVEVKYKNSRGEADEWLGT
jgi:hypothetical protein